MYLSLLIININSFKFFKSKKIGQISFFFVSLSKLFDYVFFLEKTVLKGALYSLVPYFPRCPIFLVPYILVPNFLGCPAFYGTIFSGALYSHHRFIWWNSSATLRSIWRNFSAKKLFPQIFYKQMYV